MIFFILEILSATSKVTEKTAVREGSAACWNLRMNDPSAFIAADRFWGSNILLLKKNTKQEYNKTTPKHWYLAEGWEGLHFLSHLVFMEKR